jgi:hypothetical protein
MQEKKLIHVLQAGQKLSIRWRTAEGLVRDNLRTMRLTSDGGGNPYADGWITKVDERGISIYITRGYTCGGDMEAFMPRDTLYWQAYFEPVDAYNQSYVRSAHFSRIFPKDFL